MEPSDKLHPGGRLVSGEGAPATDCIVGRMVERIGLDALGRGQISGPQLEIVTRFLSFPARNIVPILTELSWLHRICYLCNVNQLALGI